MTSKVKDGRVALEFLQNSQFGIEGKVLCYIPDIFIYVSVSPGYRNGQG